MRRPEPVFSPDALRQLRHLTIRNQRILVNAIRIHLGREDPGIETKDKFRLRRASLHADYELRVAQMRAFYRVRDDGQAVIGVVGQKVGNRLIVEGKEFEL